MDEREISKEDNDKWSGTIQLVNNEVIFTSRGEILGQFILEDIKIIGEMTSEAEPTANDWFLIFINKNNEPFFIPMYATDMKKFREQISNKLNVKITPKLFASTDFDSNVIYPEHLSGEKLFEFKEVEPINVWEKIGKFLGLGKPIVPVLTEKIRLYTK